MDVVFALDSSFQLRLSDFEQQKKFVHAMIDGFTISKEKTHVGLITVRERARKDIELTENTQAGTLKDALDRVNFQAFPPSSPTTRLADMLRRAFEIFQNGGRTGVS